MSASCFTMLSRLAFCCNGIFGRLLNYTKALIHLVLENEARIRFVTTINILGSSTVQYLP